MAPEKEENQEGVDPGAQAIDQNQELITLSGQPHQTIIDQVEEGKPLVPVGGQQVIPEGVPRHLQQGGPVIYHVKREVPPE
jgi:hypothetical protein